MNIDNITMNKSASAERFRFNVLDLKVLKSLNTGLRLSLFLYRSFTRRERSGILDLDRYLDQFLPFVTLNLEP
jgi:hypothetical protein